jgi:uncharacterized protein YeaO (DUF488 family)
MILQKAVSDSIEPEKDGLRILVSRFRGRGRDQDRYDVWMASLAPSEQLIHDLKEREIDWTGFSRRYRDEIFCGGEVDDRNSSVKNHGQKFTLRLLREMGARQNVTLLCHCCIESPECHRLMLARWIEESGP